MFGVSMIKMRAERLWWGRRGRWRECWQLVLPLRRSLRTDSELIYSLFPFHLITVTVTLAILLTFTIPSSESFLCVFFVLWTRLMLQMHSIHALIDTDNRNNQTMYYFKWIHIICMLFVCQNFVFLLSWPHIWSLRLGFYQPIFSSIHQTGQLSLSGTTL